MDEMVKYGVNYIRVSSDKQVDGYSLDSQDELCTQKAKQVGFEVVKTFREEGVSGTTIDRPALKEMIDYCLDKKNNVSAVFVYSFSRLNRNTIDFLNLRFLLSKHGVNLFSVSEPTGNTPVDRFVETIFAAKDLLENQTRAQNVANSLRKRFLEGNITSRPPVGYLIQKVNGKSLAVKDPETFETIKSMWHRAATEKLSTRDVARELNKLGVRTKHSSRSTKFMSQSISKMFKNKFYMGILVSEKYGETKGNHEPMVDASTFYYIQSLIDGRRSEKVKHFSLREDFALRGIVKCHLCDAKLSSAWSKGKNKKYAYYSCQSRGVHKNISFSKDKLEDAFLEYIKSLQPSEKYMQYISEFVKEKYHAKFNQLSSSADKVLKDIDLLQATKKKLAEKHLAGIYSDEDFMSMRDDLDIQIAVKEGIFSEKSLEKIDIDTILQFIVHYLTNLSTAFIEASPEGRLKIGCSIFPSGVVFDGTNFRTPEIGRGYKLNSGLTTNPAKMGDPTGARTRNQKLKRLLLYH